MFPINAVTTEYVQQVAYMFLEARIGRRELPQTLVIIRADGGIFATSPDTPGTITPAYISHHMSKFRGCAHALITEQETQGIVHVRSEMGPVIQTDTVTIQRDRTGCITALSRR